MKNKGKYMRICLVHEEYPEETNFGGIATYQKRIAEEYVRLGHKVVVIARGLSENQHYFDNGVEVYRIFKPTTNNQVDDYVFYRNKVADLLCQLQNDGIDIIEVPDWGAETVLFEPHRSVPLIVRLHTPLKVWLQFNRNNFGNVTQTMLDWEDKMLKSADCVTCCSNILKQIICKSFNIQQSKIFVTPNPANLSSFKKDTSIAKTETILYVGSLEERKGVCVLAKALNIFFKKFPNATCTFIGKDTNRNSENISTKEYIKKLLKIKFRKKVSFLGQLPNYELNKYYNQARVAVFPSLFDNFPYVTLEAMATGVHVVGSKNSGMVEMLNDASAIYKTPNYKSLAQKLIQKYNLSFKTPYNEKNIKRVQTCYSPEIICKNMIELYQKVITDYNLYSIQPVEIKNVFNIANINESIINFKRNTNGVANAVIEAETNKSKYVIKRYNNNVDFAISNLLYNCYQKANINACKPINNQEIIFNNKKYNIFKFIAGKQVKLTNKTLNFLANLVCINRECDLPTTINEKCEKYYNVLINNNSSNDMLKKQINAVLRIYKDIRSSDTSKQHYINHGDISKTNIIQNHNEYYLIDFDEALIGPKFYDYAVICVKFFGKNGTFRTRLMQKFTSKIMKQLKCDKNQLNESLKYYLCKILLEKFALHVENKIDLFSPRQQQDNFQQYLYLLLSL